jgi:tripartite-type tricarboxylate transporter receptor subunit TctC
VAEEMGKSLGQPIVIENVAGAGGSTALTRAARADADGYTIAIGNAGTSAATYTINPKLPFTPDSFAPIAMVAKTFGIVALRKDFPVKNLAEFIAYAKKNPGKINLGHAGIGSSNFLICKSFVQAADIDVTLVGYRGGAPALTDAIGGQITMVFADLVTGTPQIKSGKVRALGVTSQKRAVLLPEVPAIAETLPGFELIAWFALFTNAQARDDIPARLNAESAKILARPDVRDRFAVMGIEVAPTTRAELAAFVKSEIAKWARLTKAAGMLPE